MKHSNLKITELNPDNMEAIQKVAELLVRGFREHNPDGWPDIESALQEVEESFHEGRISRIAVNDNNTVIGWIGGIRKYHGKTWELHPLVVHPDFQRKGIGWALVKDLEEQVKERGGITIWIGTDDEDNMTTVSGTDLYPKVLEHLAGIENIKGHLYEFYQKLGYTIVGILPDANGPGKPDIFMAKRVGG